MSVEPAVHASAASLAPAANAANSSSSSVLAADPHSLSIILKYRDRPSVKEDYSRVLTDFLDCTRDLAKAKKALTRFQEKCNRNGVFHSLPKAISLDIVDRLQLPTVSDQPDYWKSTKDTIKKIEVEAGKQIYNELFNAKSKHIAHLEQRATAAIFITTALTRFKESVKQFATAFENQLGQPFPSDTCIAEFETHVRSTVADAAMKAIDTSFDQEKQQAALKEADHIGQQRMLDGAHTGDNIRQIAISAAQNFMAQHQRQESNKQKQAAANAQTTPATPTQHRQDGFTAPTHHSSTSGQASARKNSGPRNSASFQPRTHQVPDPSASPRPYQNKKRSHSDMSEEGIDNRLTVGDSSPSTTRLSPYVVAPKNGRGATDRRPVQNAPPHQQRHKKSKTIHQASRSEQLREGDRIQNQN